MGEKENRKTNPMFLRHCGGIGERGCKVNLGNCLHWKKRFQVDSLT
jgi:hypothetical protein